MLTQAEVSVLRGMVEQNIQTISMLGFKDYIQDGVDLKTLLCKLSGTLHTQSTETPVGPIAGSVVIVTDVGQRSRVDAVRVIRYLTGWGLKQALDAYNANDGCVVLTKGSFTEDGIRHVKSNLADRRTSVKIEVK